MHTPNGRSLYRLADEAGGSFPSQFAVGRALMRLGLVNAEAAVHPGPGRTACRMLNGEEQRAVALPGLRAACATGRIALRWTTSALYVREHPRPSNDPEEARIELCRRHARAFGLTTPAAFAWWAAVSARDAKATFAAIVAETIRVDLAGHVELDATLDQVIRDRGRNR